MSDIIVSGFDEFEALMSAMFLPAEKVEITEDGWGKVIGAMEHAHQRQFETAQAPDGQPWQKLSQRTIMEKGHATILVDTGDLLESLTNSSATHAIRETTLDEVIFGTNREFAARNQEGEGNVPARPHTGFSEGLISESVDIVADVIVGMMIEATP